MQEELERLRARMVELTRGFSTVQEDLEIFSDFLELRGMVGRHKPKLLVCDKQSLTCPLPSHVDLLKVAGPRCQYTLGTVALCPIFSSFFRRGL